MDTFMELNKKYEPKMVINAMRRLIGVGILAWGKPKSVNRSSYNDREQWCYESGQFVYVKDGVITAWSD